MFCPNCGKQIPDKSKFCSVCGTNLQKAAKLFSKMDYKGAREETPGQQSAEAQPDAALLEGSRGSRAIQPEQSYVSRGSRAIQPEQLYGPQAGSRNTPPEQSYEPQGRRSGQHSRFHAAPQAGGGRMGQQLSEEGEGRSRKPNFLIIGLIAATFFASLIITIVIFAGSSEEGSALVYLSEGTYGVIRDLESGTGMELVGARSDGETQSMLKFGGDGKTIFFMTRYDGISGTLNRTNYTRMRMTSSRNEEQVETVAQEVTAFEPCGEAGVLYTNENRTLFYNEGQESIQIAKSVDWYMTDEKGRILYAVGEGDYTLYGAMLTDPDNRQKLVSGLSGEACEALSSLPEGERLSFDHIPYVENGNLYTTGFDRKPTLIAENVTMEAPGTGASAHPAPVFFYYVRTEETLVRYDRLGGDPGAVKDEVVKAPARNDYMVPAYEWVTIMNINAAEEDFEQLMTSCTLPLAGLEGSSMEETARKVGLTVGRAGTLAAEFVEKHAGAADADGLIPITEDVKADLKKMADATGMRNWLMFCLTRQESGTELDRDAYERARAVYAETEARNRLRATLKEPLPLYTLCYFRNGTAQTVLTDVVFCTGRTEGAQLMLTGESLGTWFSQKQFGDLTELTPSAAEADMAAALLRSGRVYTVPAEAVAAAGGENVSLYPTEKAVLLLTGDGALFAADAAGKTAGSFGPLAEHAAVCGEENGKLYYSANGYSAGEKTWADLYCFENGTSACLAKEVLQGCSCTRYQDGSLLAFTDITGTFDGAPSYELTTFSKEGSAKYVADGVTAYERINGSMIVYLSEGDLYLYNGKSHIKLKNAVDIIWISNSMQNEVCPPLQARGRR